MKLISTAYHEFTASRLLVPALIQLLAYLL